MERITPLSSLVNIYFYLSSLSPPDKQTEMLLLCLFLDGGLLYTFGDGRHGKLGLGEENFTNQFKPTLCPRFLKYNVQAVGVCSFHLAPDVVSNSAIFKVMDKKCWCVQAVCGGCHMVVLARPRDQSCGDVTLEEDDVTEDYLEKPYVELLGDTGDSSTLQRSLSARVRRRERVRARTLDSSTLTLYLSLPCDSADVSPQERSPDQFGAMFRTLPTMTPGYLHPPPPVSSQTIPPRLPPAELRHGKVPNGTHKHGSPGSKKKGTYLTSTSSSFKIYKRSDTLGSNQAASGKMWYTVRPDWTNMASLFSVSSAQAGGETHSAAESLTDTDSVKGLGETTDFLNMVRDVPLPGTLLFFDL